MTVFVDTYALIAWLNRNDGAHESVRLYLDAFQGRLVTTEWVLMEVADALARGEARALVIDFLQTVRSDPAYEVVDYEPRVYQTGFELFSSRPDKDWSLTDCISFAVMEERSLTEALTADKHFQQAGYQAVFTGGV
jgi:predicted nucleic acid-binding protein